MKKAGSRPITKDQTVPFTLTFFAALALWIAFNNYGIDGDLIGGDNGIVWAMPSALLRNLSGVFNEHVGLGINSTLGIQAIFPVLVVASLLQHAGVSTVLISRFAIAAFYFLTLFGAYLLSVAIMPRLWAQSWYGRAAAILAALFYGINNYTNFVYSSAQAFFPLAYTALPWLAYGVIVGCERNRLRGILIIVLALVFAGGSATNPALFAIALGAIFTTALLELAHGVSLKRVALVCVTGVGCGLACCAWWILPLPTFLSSGQGSADALDVHGWLSWMSSRSSFYHLFKLDGYTGGLNLPHGEWYAGALGSMVGYVPLAIALLGFGVTRRKFSAAALAAFLIFLFLAKGNHAPFGGIYERALEMIPGFAMFRSPYDKWIALAGLMLTMLFALGFSVILSRVVEGWSRNPAAHMRAYAGVALAGAIAVVLYPFPAYIGEMLNPGAQHVGFLSSVPADYQKVANALRRSPSGSRTIVFRTGSAPYPLFHWGYFGEDPIAMLAPGPIGDFQTILPNAPYLPPRVLANALAQLSIGFVVVHHDVVNPVISPDIASLVQLGLAKQAMHTRSLDLYRLSSVAAPLAVALSNPSFTYGAITPTAAFTLTGPATDPGFESFAPIGSPSGEGLALMERAGAIYPVSSFTRGETVAFVPSFGAVASAISFACPSGPGLRLVSPLRWRFGARELSSVDVPLCLSGRPVGSPAIDGRAIDLNESITTFDASSEPHTFSVAELRAGTEIAAVFDGITKSRTPAARYRAQSPGTADTVEIEPFPHDSGGATTIDAFDSSGDLLGSADDRHSAIHFNSVLHSGDKISLILRSPVSSLAAPPRSIRLLLDQTAPIMRTFTVDPANFVATALSHETPYIHAAVSASDRLAVSPRIEWYASTPGDSSDGSLSVPSLHGTTSDRAVGNAVLSPSGRYDFSFRYKANGRAELTFGFEGTATSTAIPLIRDGRMHDGYVLLKPPQGATGRLFLSARSDQGNFQIGEAGLSLAGPNGELVAVRNTRAHFRGRILTIEHPIPGFFKLHVADCTPCMIGLNIGDGGNWLVDGTVLQRFAGPGGGTGPWAGIATGSAAWLVREPSGIVTFIYRPALLCLIGLVISSAAAGLFGCLALTYHRAFRYNDPSGGKSEETLALTKLRAQVLIPPAVGCISVPVLAMINAQVSEFAADVLWWLLIGLALYTLIRSRNHANA